MGSDGTTAPAAAWRHAGRELVESADRGIFAASGTAEKSGPDSVHCAVAITHADSLSHRRGCASPEACDSSPLLPYVDRRVLDVVFNVTPHHIAKRQLQYAIVDARFPQFAAVPQDTNSFLFESARRTAQRRALPWQRLSSPCAAASWPRMVLAPACAASSSRAVSPLLRSRWIVLAPCPTGCRTIAAATQHMAGWCARLICCGPDPR